MAPEIPESAAPASVPAALPLANLQPPMGDVKRNAPTSLLAAAALSLLAAAALSLPSPLASLPPPEKPTYCRLRQPRASPRHHQRCPGPPSTCVQPHRQGPPPPLLTPPLRARRADLASFLSRRLDARTPRGRGHKLSGHLLHAARPGHVGYLLRLAHRKPAHPRPPQQRRAALHPRRFRHRAHGLAPPPPRTPRQARVGHALAPRSSTCSASRCDFGHPQAPRTTCHLILRYRRRAAVPTAPSAAVVCGTWVSCAWAEVDFLFGAREAGVLCP